MKPIKTFNFKNLFLLLWYPIGQKFVGQNFSSDKIFDGQNFSSDKIFDIKPKFRQFCQSNFCQIRYKGFQIFVYAYVKLLYMSDWFFSYQQYFDLEGETGLVVRAIGTSVTLVKDSSGGLPIVGNSPGMTGNSPALYNGTTDVYGTEAIKFER